METSRIPSKWKSPSDMACIIFGLYCFWVFVVKRTVLFFEDNYPGHLFYAVFIASILLIFVYLYKSTIYYGIAYILTIRSIQVESDGITITKTGLTINASGVLDVGKCIDGDIEVYSITHKAGTLLIPNVLSKDEMSSVCKALSFDKHLKADEDEVNRIRSDSQ